MTPNNQPEVNQVDQDLVCGPEGVEALLVGDLNDHLAQPRDICEEYLATALANYGLVDQTLHFILRRRYRGKGG